MLTELKAYIKKRFAEEFDKQGHKLTGAAEESIKFVDVIQQNNRRIEVWANYYVQYVDKGVKANEINSPYARARIEGLTNYFKMRGVEEKKAKSYAFATATIHAGLADKARYGSGMPTKGSYRYSSTGKRTGFTNEMTTTADVNHMGELISNEIYTSIDASITNLIQENNKKIR